MEILKIKLNSTEDVKNFNAAAEKLVGDIDVRCERYIVDGKSIMGLLSLNLTKPLTVEIINDSEENSVKAFKKEIESFIIQ